MGFYFRRSSSFGPFRFNFSNSGVGASVGIKGARLTLSPKGSTYITVGSGGFYYRQNLGPGKTRSSPSAQYQTVEAQPSVDEIKTADVKELLQSSKGELVDSLNKRAQMFNPATLLYVLSAICAVVSFVYLTGATSSGIQPALPDSSASPDVSRQANRTDEYALLLSRYGQPSKVSITQAGPVLLRTSVYEAPHLAIDFVPAGCVDSYNYYKAHKNDVAPSRGFRRHHATTSVQPPCVPPLDKASTIVGYRNTASGSEVDHRTAESYLAGIGVRTAVPPIIKIPDVLHTGKHERESKSDVLSIEYNEATLKSDLQRITNLDASSKKDVKTGAEFLAGALLLLISGVIVHRNNNEKRTTRLVYDLSGIANAQQQTLDSTLEQLTRSRMIWRVDSQTAIMDWKRNAGASYNVEREQISVSKAVPPRVESNLVPMCIDIGKLKMFFLPDQVLYRQRGTFASIEYKDLKFQAASTRFIENQVQASDSQQVGSTWRYVRKDGGPDRRFNNNRQLPIMLYGIITAVSSGGLNLLLHTSNVLTASSFADSFRSFQAKRDQSIFGEVPHTDDKSTSTQEQKDNLFCPPNVAKAMVVLGVKPGATFEQAAVAYRHMAQMYHPDKTAGLGPELQKLAEERMKEINAAHQLVKQHLGKA